MYAGRYDCRIVTHAVYVKRLQGLPHTGRLELTGIATPPVPLPPTLPPPSRPNPDAPNDGKDDAQTELDMCLAACAGAGVLGFNLASKCGYHIAELLHVPCMVVSPSIPPPTSAPSPALIRTLLPPALRKRLQQQEEAEVSLVLNPYEDTT